MNYVKDFAGLKVYAQEDPLDVYRREGLVLFETMQKSLGRTRSTPSSCTSPSKAGLWRAARHFERGMAEEGEEKDERVKGEAASGGAIVRAAATSRSSLPLRRLYDPRAEPLSPNRDSVAPRETLCERCVCTLRVVVLTSEFGNSPSSVKVFHSRNLSNTLRCTGLDRATS